MRGVGFGRHSPGITAATLGSVSRAKDQALLNLLTKPVSPKAQKPEPPKLIAHGDSTKDER